MTSLTLISNLIRTRKFQIALAGFVAAIILSLVLIEQAPKGTVWNDLFIGRSTQKDVEDRLGKPLSSKTQDGKTIYTYPTENQYRQNQVIFFNEVTSLVKEQVISKEKGTLNDYINKYGQPDSTLFGSHGTIAPGHFWGGQGLLVFAGQHDGTIIEIWYFGSTTLERFLKEHPELSSQPKENFKP